MPEAHLHLEVLEHVQEVDVGTLDAPQDGKHASSHLLVIVNVPIQYDVPRSLGCLLGLGLLAAKRCVRSWRLECLTRGALALLAFLLRVGFLAGLVRIDAMSKTLWRLPPSALNARALRVLGGGE